jgi:hypothetical protein
VTAAPPRPRPRPTIPPARPVPAPVVPSAPAALLADPAVQQQRRLRLAATLAGARLRMAVVPGCAARRRQSIQLCSAARILTALGVRVRVVQSGTPWPRHRPLRLVTAADPGWLGDLALLTAVPRTTSGWSVVAARAVPSPVAATVPAAPADAALCPVAVRFRDGDRLLDGVPRRLSDVVAVRDLTVEVELLPALDPPRTAAA